MRPHRPEGRIHTDRIPVEIIVSAFRQCRSPVWGIEPPKQAFSGLALPLNYPAPRTPRPCISR